MTKIEKILRILFDNNQITSGESVSIELAVKFAVNNKKQFVEENYGELFVEILEDLSK